MFNATNLPGTTGELSYFLSDRGFNRRYPKSSYYATNAPVHLCDGMRKEKHPFPPRARVTIAKPDDAPKPQGTPPALELSTAKEISKEIKKKTSRTEKPTRVHANTGASDAKPETPKPPSTMTIDFDGINGRVARVPVGADNYGGLTAKAGHLLYAVGSAFYYGRTGDRPTNLKIFAFKDRKEATIAEDIRGYTLSEDGSKVLVAQGPGYNIYDATPQGDKTKKAVSTAGLFVDRVPAEEWNQIFHEVWRRYRDWFYVPNMHGYDW